MIFSTIVKGLRHFICHILNRLQFHLFVLSALFISFIPQHFTMGDLTGSDKLPKRVLLLHIWKETSPPIERVEILKELINANDFNTTQNF